MKTMKMLGILAAASLATSLYATVVNSENTKVTEGDTAQSYRPHSEVHEVGHNIASSTHYHLSLPSGYKWGDHQPQPMASKEESWSKQQSLSGGYKWGSVRNVSGIDKSIARSSGIESSPAASSNQSGYKWGIRGFAEQSGYKWGIRGLAGQAGYKWGIRGHSVQTGYKWGIRSNSAQAGYKWGIRSNSAQAGYKWGIRGHSAQAGYKWGIR
jgi:hypothetical protein